MYTLVPPRPPVQLDKTMDFTTLMVPWPRDVWTLGLEVYATETVTQLSTQNELTKTFSVYIQICEWES